MPDNFPVSVILPTRNPAPGRLAQTFAGLAAQTLPRAQWEIVVVDNASQPPLAIGAEVRAGLPPVRVLVETKLGLTPARLAGIAAARGEVLVFVDDDNVLDPDYLAAVVRRFAELPSLGAGGGPIRPQWETPPPEWTREFHGLLALRERGIAIEVAQGGADARWPEFAPVGAGLAVRRRFALAYAQAVAHDPRRAALDRAGASLASGGDNDLVFTVLHAGGDVGYFPELKLTHLIPAQRLAPEYLARLNRGIMRTWVRVLGLHGQSPWPAIARFTVPLRQLRAWWRFRAWQSAAHRIRWQGACGQLEGQADLRELQNP